MNIKACWCIAMLLCVPAVAEAKMEIGDGPPGNVTAVEIWADQKAKNKQVVIPYADFLVMVSKVEHSEKLKNRAMADTNLRRFGWGWSRSDCG